MKFFLVFFVAFLSAAAQAELPSTLLFAHEDLEANLTWRQGPASAGESKLQIEWRDQATHALRDPGSTFKVTLWMPSMGHGSAPTKIESVVDGHGQVVTATYLITKIYFIMPGAWDVRVGLKSSDGTDETQTLKINAP